MSLKTDQQIEEYSVHIQSSKHISLIYVLFLYVSFKSPEVPILNWNLFLTRGLISA